MTSLEEIFETQGKKRWAVACTTAKERISKLLKLRKAIVERQQEFYDAIWTDFHKPRTEAWLTEVLPALEEIDYAIKHLPDWVEDQPGKWSWIFPTSSSISHFEPKGRVLIMAPWNYPFLLFITPMVAASPQGTSSSRSRATRLLASQPFSKASLQRFLKKMKLRLYQEQAQKLATSC